MTRLACLALLLCFPVLAAAQQPGRLTYAEGQVRLLRGSQAFVAPSGLQLVADDIVETPAGGSAIVELNDGTLIATAAQTRLMLGNAASKNRSLLLLDGWTKVQADGKAGANSLMTPQALITWRTASLVVRSSGGNTELFVESGDAVYVANNKPLQVKAGQYLSHSGNKPPTKADSAFNAAIPRAFRDRIPSLAARHADSKAVPRLLADLQYDDVADWLHGPGAWRAGFVKRFEPRLQDKNFRASVEKNLARHPEWARSLKPDKPPAKTRPGAPSNSTSDSENPQP